MYFGGVWGSLGGFGGFGGTVGFVVKREKKKGREGMEEREGRERKKVVLVFWEFGCLGVTQVGIARYYVAGCPLCFALLLLWVGLGCFCFALLCFGLT